MINDENNISNDSFIQHQMCEKEFYVGKLEIYEELNEKEKRKILPSILPALGGIIILSSINKYNSYDVIYPIIVGSMLVCYSIFEIAIAIVRKAGYKKMVNIIKQILAVQEYILELCKLQNDQETIQDGTLDYNEVKIKTSSNGDRY